MKKKELKWQLELKEIKIKDQQYTIDKLQGALDRANAAIKQLCAEISANKYTSKLKKCKYCNRYERSLLEEGRGQCALLRSTGVARTEYFKRDDDSCRFWEKITRDIPPNR